MSLLDINLEDRQKLKILPNNEEVQLRISRADITPNKNFPERSNLAVVLDTPSDPLVDDIRVWIPIPTEELREEDPKRHTKQLDRLAQFCGAFGVTPPIDTDDMVGREGWAILSEEEGQNGEAQNGVRRFLEKR